jgi:two-component system, NtrC family, sensor kinase
MFSDALSFIRARLRFKLLALVLVPGVLIMGAILAIAYYWSHTISYGQLLTRVSADLGVAHDGVQRIQQDRLRALGQLAGSYGFQLSFNQGDWSVVGAHLDLVVRDHGFDFLHLVDRQGRSLLVQQDEPFTSRFSSLRTRALQGEAGAAIEIFSPEDLRRESPELAERARIPLLGRARTGGSGPDVEERGMVLRALYPVKDMRGRVLAVLDGGVLVNHNHALVDALRDLVYAPGSLPEGSRGTVTLFLDDVPVSTNVPLGPEGRAVGSRVAHNVREAVLGRGETWIDRSYVVSDWYVSAYRPIRDSSDQVVGMLYTGFLEAPFQRAYTQAMWALIITFLFGLAVSALFIVRGTKTIFRPLETMAGVVHAIKKGENRRIGEVGLRSQDEVGQLAREFDAMLDLLQERNRQIQRGADELESKVQERTRELARRNMELQRLLEMLVETRRQLVTSAKLAALGELTAGVAHEINNPTAVILGNIDLITQELGEAAQPVRGEIALIVEQVERIRRILDGLLQYSRAAGSAELPAVDVNRLIEESLVLVRHEFARHDVDVRTELAARTAVRINPQELQQVLINLAVNALHALPAGGRLELATEDWPNQGVVIHVRDNGCGIEDRHLARVFDPFFTTKGHDGTGLGLYVSYGIVQRYGGHITAESQPGVGSEFSVWLRAAPPPSEDEETLILRQLRPHIDPLPLHPPASGAPGGQPGGGFPPAAARADREEPSRIRSTPLGAPDP